MPTPGPGTTAQINFTAANLNQLAADLQNAIAKAMGVASNIMVKETQAAFKKMAASAGSGPISSKMAQNAQKVASTILSAEKAVGKLNKQLQETNAVMARIGGGPTQAVNNAAKGFRIAGQSLDEFRQNEQRIISDPAVERFFTNQMEASRKWATQLSLDARKQTDAAITSFAKQAEQRRTSEQNITGLAKSEAAERIVTLQTESAREVALTKRSAQVRVEVLRAAVNQIRALERGLAAVFRTTASAIRGSFRAAGSVFKTLTAPIRNFRSELTVGLDSTLERRSSILRRHFTSEESIMRSSVTRQEAILTRLDTRLSKGVVGAATGRSRIGGLFGGLAAGFGGAGLFIGLQKLATVSADFEQGLAVLDAQLGLTDKQMESVRQTAIDLGNDLTLPGVSAKQGAEAIQILAKQFGSLGKGAVPAAQAAAKGVLQLSRATQSSAEDAAALVGTAVNVFGVSADKAVSVADQITGALTKAAGVGFGDFSLAFKQGASVFAQFQVPAVGAKDALIDFNTAIAVLARGGLIGSDAGTSLKQFFLQANRGTADSVKNLKALTERAGETGTAFFDAAGKARPLSESLAIMRKGLQGLSDQERNKTLQKIFGSDAIRAANILLGTSEKTFDVIEKGIRKQGLAAEIAAAQNTGLRGAMDALSSVVETIAIELLPKITVPLGKFVLAFAGFVTTLKDADSGPFKIIRDGLKGIAVGLGAVLAVKTAIEVIGLLGPAISGILTPMGLLAIAAAGLGAAFFILRDNAGPVGDAVRKLQGKLGDVVDSVKTFFTDVFTGTPISDQIDQMITGVDSRSLGQKLGDKIREIFATVRAFISTATTFLGDVFTGSDINDAFAAAMGGIDTRTLGEKIGDKIREIFTVVRDTVTDVASNIQQLFGDLLFGPDLADRIAKIAGVDTRSKFEKIGGTIRDVLGKMAGIVRDAFTTVVSGVARAFNAVRGAIVRFWDRVKPILQPAIDGLVAFGDAVGDLFKLKPSKGLLAVGGIIAAIVGGFAVAGPLGAVVGGLGAGLAALFATGLNDDLGKALGGIGETIIDALKGPFESVKSFLGDFFSPANLEGFVRGFLDVVERVGFIIGNIATDPRVLAAAAALGAAGVVMAARFIEGLGRGVIDNIGKVFDGLLNAVGIEGDFDSLGRKLATALVVGFGAILIGGRLLGGITRGLSALGLTAGKQFGEAIKTGTQRSLTVGGAGLGAGPKALMQGLFGTPGAAAADAAKVAKAATGEFDRNLRLLKATGADTTKSLNAYFGDGIAGGLRQSRQDVLAVKASLGEARVAGLGARDAIKQIGTALKLGPTGGGSFIGGIRQGFGDLKASLVGQGRNVATLVGTSIASGIGIAFGAQMLLEGEDMGQKTIGALTIAAGIASAWAVGGPWAALAATVVAGITLVTQAFTGQSPEAKEATSQIAAYRDALLQIGPAAQEAAATSTLLQEWDTLGASVRQTFLDLGGSIPAFVDQLTQGPGAGKRTVADIIEDLGPASAAVADQLRTGPLTALDDLNDSLGHLDPRFGSFITELSDAGIDLDDFRDILGFVNDEAFRFAEGSKDAQLRVKAMTREVSGAHGAFRRLGRGQREAFTIPPGAVRFQNFMKQNKDVAIANATGLSVMFGAPVDGITPKVEGLNTDLVNVKSSAEKAGDQVSVLFGLGKDNTLHQTLNELIIGLEGFGAQFEGVDITTVLGKAKVEEGARDKADEFLAAMEEAIRNGKITTVPQIVNAKQKFLEELTKELDKGGRTKAEAQVLMKVTQRIDGATTVKDLRRILRNATREEQTVDIIARVRPKAKNMTFGEVQQFLGETRAQLFARARRILRHERQALDFLIDVHPRFKGLSLGQIAKRVGKTRADLIANALAALRRRRRKADLEVEIPFKPKPVFSPMTQEELATAITGATSGPQGFGGGIGIHGAEVRGIPAQDVAIPINVTPTINVTEAAGDLANTGEEMAAAIALGVAVGAPLIAAALNNALKAAFRSGAGAAGGVQQVGVALATALAQGIESQQQAVVGVGIAIARGAALGSVTQAGAMVSAGNTLGAGFADGLDNAVGSAFSAGAALGSAGRTAAQGFSLFSTGLDLAKSFASGILAGRVIVYLAGFSLGSSALAGAKAALQAKSPSKVFRNLGRDVGKGFVLGIADSESDIASAMQQAVQDAIAAAQAAVPRQGFARAVGAAELFRATQPSALPGGPTGADVMRALDDARQAIRDFHRDLAQEVRDLKQSTKDAIRDLRDKLAEKLDKAFAAGAAGLDTARQRINLGGLGRQVGKGLTDILKTAHDRVLELEKKANDESLSEEERAKAREQLIDARAKEARLKTQLQALNEDTAVGREAANVILDFGQQIRDLGQSMRDQGASATQVANTMRHYRDQLIAAAKAQGINGQALRDLLRDLGLTDAQLGQFVNRSQALRAEFEKEKKAEKEALIRRLAGIATLNEHTEAGRRNRAAILDNLQAIRDFGAEALEAGTPVRQVVRRMKDLRQNLVQTARQAGLPIDQIRQLIKVMGLSNDQIKEFVKQLEDLNNAVPDVPSPTTPTLPTNQLPGPLVGAINIYPPYGDPEAIGLGAANKLAFFAA